ncbi:MAG: hypothetical protein ABSC11_01180 [Smithella sp.]|jgi:hypothetical protein
MKYILCCFVLIFLLEATCHAFNPVEHGSISRQATSLYEACTGRVIPEELSKVFIKRAVAEDNISLERITNWHFYNNGNKIGRYYLLFYGANDKTFRKLSKKLDSLFASGEFSSKEIYKVAGRIAHHIQDMSVPAHVVPIYHWKDDKFENYTPASGIRENTSELCKMLNGPVIAPLDLLEQSAQNTLKAIAGPVVFDSGETMENETWMKFWGGSDNEDLAGFKTYGAYGNVFGMVPACNSPVCRSYNKDTYDRFFNERYMRAVIDTVRLLLFIDQRMGRP